MRTLTIFLFFLLGTTVSVHANEIDSLKTVEDVQKFLINRIDKEWDQNTVIRTDGEDTTTFAKGNFFKIDLNGDGLTDLVINGEYCVAITDSGNGHYGVFPIDRGVFYLHKYNLVNILYQDKMPILVLQKYDKYNFSKTKNTVLDTIVFKFDGFIEYSPLPDSLKIKEIKFSTSPCFGRCHVFSLSIKKNRKAIYNAIKYNDKKGKFRSTVDEATYNTLVATINYMHLLLLKDDYRVNWTDDRTITLRIKYNNGHVKEISDYGGIGTFGLKNLYDQLYTLKNTQKWH
jgi:hypothetical protein